MKFVWFRAVEHIELVGAFPDGALDGHSHGDHAHPVFREIRIESRLEKVEGASVAKSVERAHRPAVETQQEEPQPSTAKRLRRELFVKCDVRGGVKSVGSIASL